MKIKRVITKIDRYLYKDEAKGIHDALLLNEDIKKENLKIHKITNQAYMIELKELSIEIKKLNKRRCGKCKLYSI